MGALLLANQIDVAHVALMRPLMPHKVIYHSTSFGAPLNKARWLSVHEVATDRLVASITCSVTDASRQGEKNESSVV